MLFFKRKSLYPAKMAERADADKLHKAYVQHLHSIKSQLPESAWKLAALKFHDAVVVSVSQPKKRELTITLDGGYSGSPWDFMSDRLLNGRYTTLSFFGVKQVWVPPTIVRDWWLYEEVNLSDIAAFDYQAMLANDEIRIQADDVVIQSHDSLNR
ncbi:MAG TPA: DUF4085 family protein [Pyrinomonadaceae bacterium]